MIEITDEMVAAFQAAWDHENRVINDCPGEYVESGARDRAGLAAVLAIVERDQQRCQWCNTSAGHHYLSTGCLHGEHDYCQSMTGCQGEKRPGQCKFCDARCVCPCHADGAS